jgi:hypothetical protein
MNGIDSSTRLGQDFEASQSISSMWSIDIMILENGG